MKNDAERLKNIKRMQDSANRAKDSADEAKKDGVISEIRKNFATASKYLGPVARIIGWTAGSLKDTFMWSSFERDNGDFKRDAEGDLTFSKNRLAKVTSGAAIACLAGYMAVSAAYFYGTQFEELVYTTGKQEIVTGEKYQFTGCTSLPCSTEEDNGKFYKIKTSLVFPTLIYPEEDVYANIPLQDAACYAKGYGIYFRTARFLIKSADWWQNVYSVECRPYTDAEKATAINSGRVIAPKRLPETQSALPEAPVSKAPITESLQL